MRKEPLIRRYEHNYFKGWVVSTKRAGQRWVEYFSDGRYGRQGGLRAARAYRDRLVAELPWPARVKRSYTRNTTGVIGVALVKEHARSGKLFVRYVAQWPTRFGRSLKASFSVARYGRAEARRRAIAARRKGLAELLGTGPAPIYDVSAEQACGVSCA